MQYDSQECILNFSKNNHIPLVIFTKGISCPGFMINIVVPIVIDCDGLNEVVQPPDSVQITRCCKQEHERLDASLRQKQANVLGRNFAVIINLCRCRYAVVYKLFDIRKRGSRRRTPREGKV